jgi:hypothetical protein
MLRLAWVRIIVYLLPASLIAYGDHQINFSILKNADQQRLLESVCFFVGILSTIVIFPVVIERQKNYIRSQNKTLKKSF